MKKTSLTVSSCIILPPSEIEGKIVSHVELNGASVLTCWHDTWADYLRCMNLKRFYRVNIRTTA